MGTGIELILAQIPNNEQKRRDIKKYETKNSLQELCLTYFVHNYPNQEDIVLTSVPIKTPKTGAVKHATVNKNNLSFWLFIFKIASK